MLDIRHIKGKTTKVITVAIMLARYGNDVIIISSNPSHILQMVTTKLSYVPETPIVNFKNGWIMSMRDNYNQVFRELIGRKDCVVIFDNFCINDSNRSEFVRMLNYIRVPFFTYNNIMDLDYI